MSLALAVDEGSGPLVVLVHGFPELPSCWHHQVGPLVEAGYRVVAPFLRGYGPSPDGASDPAAYTIDHIADDLAGVIEDCGQQQAVLVGHDWGAAAVWATAELRPERVRAVAALSVPYTARARTPPLQRLAQVFGDRFFYMLYFTEPDGRAERELGADLRGFLLGSYAAWSGQPPAGTQRELRRGDSLLDQLVVPADLPAWLPASELGASVASFAEHGLTGPLSYYRALDLSWEQVPGYGTTGVHCPATFIAGDADLVLAFTPTRAMGPPLLTDLRADVRIPGAGHWVQQEAPEAVTTALLEFLAAPGVGANG